MRTRRAIFAATASLVLLATACSKGANDSSSNTKASATTSIQVDMVDSAFKPAAVAVKTGQKVTFTFTNKGVVPHDAFIGDPAEQAEHGQQMRISGGHTGHGAMAESALTVAPGKTGQLTHTFDKTGATEIGCNQPGHYEAGMRILVTVT